MLWVSHTMWVLPCTLQISSCPCHKIARTMAEDVRYFKSWAIPHLPKGGWPWHTIASASTDPALGFYIAHQLVSFPIAPLGPNSNCGVFYSGNISQLDFLHRWCPITVAHWNLQSRSFFYKVYHPRCLISYTCSHGSDWNTWNSWFGWVSEYFWQYSAYGLKWDLVGIETVRAAVVVACVENK